MILHQLKASLEARPGWQVIAEARDGRSSGEKVKELKFDVVILDFSMPGLNGIDATRQIVNVFPRQKRGFVPRMPRTN
jgi:DNA-binding NarL/FixJ family response regulator